MVLFVKINLGTPVRDVLKEDVKSRPVRKSKKEGIQRLYRSGKDKILGGVCGGIGEYLGVDPVIIRLIWIIAFFAWGIGLVAYIIAWIIIPRNPRHAWKD
ncbi:MAG: PspC domain-containing protein [Nanoarchaeota archaeon]|nr:PspC domain-containing protein [Nanoarchaeota archaeon]